jgi:hypothetical protein
MSIDRSRITKLISAAKRVDAITLNPTDSDQDRQSVIRKMITESVRSSNQRSILIVAIEL